jgi:predicted deacylase
MEDSLPIEIDAIRSGDFKPECFPRGRKVRADLLVGDAIRLPVLLARGYRPGKTLVATAGVHGDEYEGVRAILEVFDELDTSEMSGDLLAVPVSNPPAFWNGTRTSPLDSGNLARVFPGDPQGSATPMIAHALAHNVIAHADLFVDLHSAGVRLDMPTLVGYDANDPRSCEAALAFGCEVLWGHPAVGPGRTISFALDQKIPWLYSEARGGGRIDPGDLAIFKRGLANLLRVLSIVPGALSVEPVRIHLFGDGNVDEGLCASRDGFFMSSVGVLDAVHAGDPIGCIVDIHGRIIESFSAPETGVIAMVRAFPVVRSGDPLFLITEVKKAEYVGAT